MKLCTCYRCGRRDQPEAGYLLLGDDPEHLTKTGPFCWDCLNALTPALEKRSANPNLVTVVAGRAPDLIAAVTNLLAVPQPLLTEEQGLLFVQFAAQHPGITQQQWESADIDEINGKRVLCLRTLLGPGDDDHAYVHFCPEGVTDVEAEELTRRHNLNGLRFLDEPKSRRVKENE